MDEWLGSQARNDSRAIISTFKKMLIREKYKPLTQCLENKSDPETAGFEVVATTHSRKRCEAVGQKHDLTIAGECVGAESPQESGTVDTSREES